MYKMMFSPVGINPGWGMESPPRPDWGLRSEGPTVQVLTPEQVEDSERIALEQAQEREKLSYKLTHSPITGGLAKALLTAGLLAGHGAMLGFLVTKKGKRGKAALLGAGAGGSTALLLRNKVLGSGGGLEGLGVIFLWAASGFGLTLATIGKGAYVLISGK